VAAPVFSAVLGGALRLLAVAPDGPLAPPAEEPEGTVPMPEEPGVAEPIAVVPGQIAGTALPTRPGAAARALR